MAKAKRNTRRGTAVAKKTKAPSAPAKRRATPKRAVKRPTKKTPAPAESLVVVVSGERPLQDVAADLRRAGFEIDQMLDAIDLVTGRAAPGLRTRLAKIKGVKDVSEEHPPFNIGPPDAPVS